MNKLKIFSFLALFVLCFLEGFSFGGSGGTSSVIIDDGKVSGRIAHVSFHMSQPYSPELLEVIKSGIEVKFKYEVVVTEVKDNWFDRERGALKVEKVIKYDPLSNEYAVIASQGGEKKIFLELKKATEEFFSAKGLNITLSRNPVSGIYFEIKVRASVDKREVAGILKYIPFISPWFEVKTDWTSISVVAK